MTTGFEVTTNPGLLSTATNLTGSDFRGIISAAHLLPAQSGATLARLTFLFGGASSAGTFYVGYLGHQGTGNAYNFDGNQVAITIGGVNPGPITVNGWTTIISDAVPFTFKPAIPLVFSYGAGGTNLNDTSAASTGDASYFINPGTGQAANTAPTGVWTLSNNVRDTVAFIEMIPGPGVIRGSKHIGWF